jgi:fatty-acyl-CoA synthase
MLGAFKARSAPFNVNYRYVEEELLYLFENADARAVVFHARFAPTLERLRARLPQIRLWLQVRDESGHALLPGALDYEAALAAAAPRPPADLSPDDLYVLYTGGTTGRPKGVLWRQEDIFRAALWTSGRVEGVAQLVERARRAPGPRALPVAPFMHGAAHWVAFNAFHTGGTVVIQSHPEHFDADDVWSAVERERVTILTIVGDAFARPLLDQLHRKSYDLSSLRSLNSGGAILTAALKAQLLEQLPHVRVFDALGSSDSGARATHSTSDAGASTGSVRARPDSMVLKEDLRGRRARLGEIGWLARRGNVPLGAIRTPRRRPAPSPRSRAYAAPCPAIAASWRPTARSGSSAATPSRSAAAARRSTPRRWSTRSSTTPRSTTPSWSARRASAGASR